MPGKQSGQALPPSGDSPAGCNALNLPDEASVLLASDMHLGEHDARTAQWFYECLQTRSVSCTHLILLGDLFEAWTGDDQNDATANIGLALLRTLSEQKSVFVMRGNRDFLLDHPVPGLGSTESFSAQTGATMLADPCTLQLGEQQWLLSHGDIFCTDDEAYQQFRRDSRQAQWADAFLSQPLSARTALARQMREQSIRETANKDENLTDVNQSAVQQCLTAHKLTHLIHGHTHRPAHHKWQSQGTNHHRYVLPDWSASRQTGGFMLLNRQGLSVLPPL